MDLVQAFIKDQFQDDEEYYEEQKKKRSNPGREVQHLKKELEELKFYQELERTEFEDMKRKMSKLQKNKNSGAKASRTMTQDTGMTSADIFDSLSDDASTSDLHDKLKKKDEEIAKLQKTLKTETSPKEFGKRMVSTTCRTAIDQLQFQFSYEFY
jgi:tartrate dehydratase alpha subunit/fumarate hydratase class I-like protein